MRFLIPLSEITMRSSGMDFASRIGDIQIGDKGLEIAIVDPNQFASASRAILNSGSS